jgi:hypothetical protein
MRSSASVATSMSAGTCPVTETCAVKLQPERSFTRLTPECGKPAQGYMPDGTPACGVHLRSMTAILEHEDGCPND